MVCRDRALLHRDGGDLTDEARMQTWLDVEIAVCEAWAELGESLGGVAEIKSKAAFDVARVLEIEGHPLRRNRLPDQRAEYGRCFQVHPLA